MEENILKKIFIPSIFAITFGWIIYELLSYDNYYNGGQLTKLKITLHEKPEYYFDGNTKISYYTITSPEYKNNFRISDGALKLITENDTLKKLFKEIKSGDTVNIDIRKSETEFLNRPKNIRIVGLSTKTYEFIKPSDVKKLERNKKYSNLFFNYLILFGLGFFILRAYLKTKSKK